jgi:hypothetical protein
MNTGSTSRNVLVDGKVVKIVHAALAINRRVTFEKHCLFGSLKVELRLEHLTYQSTLICSKNKRNKERKEKMGDAHCCPN